MKQYKYILDETTNNELIRNLRLVTVRKQPIKETIIKLHKQFESMNINQNLSETKKETLNDEQYR